MTQQLRKPFLVLALIGASFLIDADAPVIGPISAVSTAEAVVGRPATPMSYAGVARRTTRRAVAAGAAGAAVVAAPVVVAPAPVVVAPAPVVVAPAPRCVQAVDPYGRIYARCY